MNWKINRRTLESWCILDRELVGELTMLESKWILDDLTGQLKSVLIVVFQERYDVIKNR